MNNEAYKRPLIILAVILVLVGFCYYQKSSATQNTPPPPPPPSHKPGEDASGGKVVITDNPTNPINEQVKKQQEDLTTLRTELDKTKEELTKTQKVVSGVRDNLDWLGNEVEEQQREQVWRDRKILGKLDKNDKKLTAMEKRLITNKAKIPPQLEGKTLMRPPNLDIEKPE